MEQINPYQSPLADSGKKVAGVGIWRKGSVLIMHKDARLPQICVKTNRAADRRVLEKTSWMTMLDGGVHEIEVPVSEAWWARKRLGVRINVACMVTGGALVAAMFLAGHWFPQRPALINVFPYLIFAAMVMVIITSRLTGNVKTGILQAKHATATHIWLKGANADYLDRFPKWPF